MNTVILGLQWGDEGKGKLVALLARDHEIIVRFQGGANAGHTVFIEGQEHVFHLVPSGLHHPEKVGVLGPGVVVDLEVLAQEVEALSRMGRPLEGRLWIDARAHLVMPYHRAEDGWEEELRGGIGSTRRGIGPTYRDLYARFGLRAGDLLHPDTLYRKLKKSLEWNNQVLAARYGKPPFQIQDMMDLLTTWAERFRPMITDTLTLLREWDRRDRAILLEGAQGSLLDIFLGTYPYVTSSHTVVGGALAGLGLPPQRLHRIVGVTKAYTTRVGRGPFPTELHDETGQRLRELGGEYGATTGRPRRCGWLDLVALRYTAWLNGVTELAITKVDVLSGFPEIRVATAYRLKGAETRWFPATLEDLEQAEPVYEELPAWPTPLVDRNTLHPQLEAYLGFLEAHLGMPVRLVSYGPQTHEVVLRSPA